MINVQMCECANVQMVTFMHSIFCSVMFKNNLCNFLKGRAEICTSYFLNIA